MKKSCIIFLGILLSISLNAQYHSLIGTPKIIKYEPIYFYSTIQNWAITGTDDGFLFVGHNKGISYYNGNKWDYIVPDKFSIIRTFAKDSAGRIWAAGYNNIGFLAIDSSRHKLKFFSIMDSLPDTLQNLQNIWSIAFSKNTLWVSSDNYSFSVNTKDYKQIDIYSPGINFAAGKIPLLYQNKSVARKDSNGIKLIFKSNSYIRRIVQYNDEIYVFSRDTIYKITAEGDILSTYKPPSPDYPYRMKRINDKWYFFDDHLIITDTNFKTILYLDTKKSIIQNSIYDVWLDPRNNVWLAGFNHISYLILNTPISYLADNSFSQFIDEFEFFNDTLYFAKRGLYYTPVKELSRPNPSVDKIPDLEYQIWEIISYNNHIYCSSYLGFYAIKNKKIEKLYNTHTNVWDITGLDSSKIIISASSNGVLLTNLQTNQTVNSNLPQGEYTAVENINDSIFWFSLSNADYQIVKAKFLKDKKQLVKINTYKVITGNYNVDTDLFIDTNKNVFINANDKIYKYLPEKDSFIIYRPIVDFFDTVTYQIFIIGIDKKNNFWINLVNRKNTQKNHSSLVLMKNQGNDKFIEINTPKTIIGRDFGIGIAQYKNYVVIGTTNGLVFYDYDYPFKQTSNQFNVFVTEIISSKNHKTLWEKIPVNSECKYPQQYKYKNNGLIFKIGSDFFENKELMQYSYKLEGLDADWSPWSPNTEKEYPFLKEGHYTFKVKAKNIYGIQSNILQYEFIIRPPWYRSTIAYIVYLLLLAGAVFSGVRLYTIRLRKRNAKLEELIQQRTYEIQAKNIELEQQKEEIQAQAEELAEINQELEKLSYIVEWTDNAILLTDKHGEFTWVNPAFTKIFGYTLEELKMHVSKNIISNRTDKRIKEKIEKCFREKITVEYEAQFKTKWGKYIWIHTTLTPILDENNEITGLIAIDSDITKFKEAEEKIKLQNENIKGSIRYAQTIQNSILPQKQELEILFDSFIIFRPKDIVSGDFYWLSHMFKNTDALACSYKTKHLNPGEYFFFAVADCTGHGVPGAFMSLIGTSLLNDVINTYRIHDPAVALEKIDKAIAEIFKNTDEKRRDGMAMSLCKFEKTCNDDKAQIEITFAGAKQNILYYTQANKKMHSIKGARRILGELFTVVNFENHKFELTNNDMIFLFTDGFKDQNNFERKKIGIKQMERIILENIDKRMEEIGAALEQFLYKWMQNTEQRDDITIVGLKVKRM